MKLLVFSTYVQEVGMNHFVDIYFVVKQFQLVDLKICALVQRGYVNYYDVSNSIIT